MTIELSNSADLLGMVGQEIGTGEWHAITQHQVNIFADATHDHQWIHVEPERAAKGPYGGPIAHGYLTLSFCPVFLDDVLKINEVTAAVNYGVNRVRFPAPVPVGSRIRGHVTLVAAEQKQTGLECAFGILVELEGSDRPACVGETVAIGGFFQIGLALEVVHELGALFEATDDEPAAFGKPRDLTLMFTVSPGDWVAD